ncbi:MAG: hypothetical protein A4E62_01339 [Syntrophorhabdus sp. PtaU1.Bin002]|nr:MAG: hypothetical protein A4E62_01339 [Syntrophorhabdus sp. PtaU1.Bin002]
MRTVVNYNIKATGEGNNKFFLLFKGMTATHLTAWNIVYPVDAFNLKRNMIIFFDKGETASWIFNFWQSDNFGFHSLIVLIIVDVFYQDGVLTFENDLVVLIMAGRMQLHYSFLLSNVHNFNS